MAGVAWLFELRVVYSRIDRDEEAETREPKHW